MLSKFNRYILVKMGLPLVGCMFFLLLTIWLMQASGYLKYLGYGVPFSLFLKMSSAIIPKVMTIIIPISLMFATIIAYNKLILTNELSIMKNSGFGKLKLAIPVILVSLIAVAMLYWMQLVAIPISFSTLVQARNQAKETYNAKFFKTGEFNRFNNILIYFNSRSTQDTFKGALFYNLSNEGESVILAKQARIINNDENDIIFVLSNGMIIHHKPAPENEIDELSFEHYVLNVNSYYNIEKKATRSYSKIKEKSLTELLHPTAQELVHHTQGAFRSVIVDKLAFPWLALFIPIMAFALVTSGQFNRFGNSFNVFMAITINAIYFSFYSFLIDLIETAPQSYPYAIGFMLIVPAIIYYKLIWHEQF